MKKFLTLLLSAILLLSLCACGNDTKTDDTPGQAAAQSTQGTSVSKVTMEDDAGGLIYAKHQLVADYEGEPAVLIYFDYTNKSGKIGTAQDIFYPQVFQNGIECEMTLPLDDNQAIQNASKEVPSGATVNVAFIYRLEDKTSPVTLKVSDTFTLDEFYQEQELLLK